MGMLESRSRHWPEHLMEATGLGFFMIAASTFATILQHLASPIRQAISEPIPRQPFMGIAMGLTAIGIIHSPGGEAVASTHQSLSETYFLQTGKNSRVGYFLFGITASRRLGGRDFGFPMQCAFAETNRGEAVFSRALVLGSNGMGTPTEIEAAA